MKGHRLRENKSTEFPANWVFFDCETYVAEDDGERQIQRLRLGVAQFWRYDKPRNPQREVIFRSGSELYDFILGCLRSRQRLMVASHNLAFDLAASGILEVLLRDGWQLSKILIESGVSAVKLRRDGTTLHFLDTINYFKTSVRSLGKAIGLEKLSVDFDTVSDRDLVAYCRRDVEILAHAVSYLRSFLKDNDLGSFGLSISQIAFNVFRHRFMRVPIYIHEIPEVINLEREAYFGGRNECFRLGYIEGPVYKLDVNSMYPFVMKSFDYPVRLQHWFPQGLPLDALSRFLRSCCVVSKVYVETEKPIFPKKTCDGKTIFPVGRFWVTGTTPSLLYALQHGMIRHVGPTAVYDRARVFEDYVSYFYEARRRWRKEGKEAFAVMAKYLLNSLYGKFGQRRYVTELVPADQFPHQDGYFEYIENGEHYRCYRIVDKVLMVKRIEEKAFNAFIAIAAHVTDYARMHLWHLIEKAGRENVYYCDTDSLFVNREGFERLTNEIDDTALGKLKLEDVVDYVEIRGCKDYSTPSGEKVKGIRKNAEKLSENRFRQLHFPTLKRIVRDQMLNEVVLRYVVKELKREYDKGLVLKEGHVMPIALDEPV